MSSKLETRVIQITNVAPATTKDQLKTLFQFIGRIREVKLFPPEGSEHQASSKVCYVEFDDNTAAGVSLHLNNTVFIDRALIVVPVMDGKIPDDTMAMQLTPQAARMGSGQPTWPTNVVSQVTQLSGVGAGQVITTYDPRLNALGLPQYPPLPATLDASRVEEIRRTIYIGNLDPKTTPESLVNFFSQAGEVKYVRMAAMDGDARSAYLELTDQRSVATCLGYNGYTFGTRIITVSHAKTSISKPLKKSRSRSRSRRRSRSRYSRSRSRSRRRSRSRSRAGRRRRSRSRSRRRSRSPRRIRRSRSRSPRRRRSRSRSGIVVIPARERRRSRSRSKRRSRTRTPPKRRSRTPPRAYSSRRSRSRSRGARRKSRSRSPKGSSSSRKGKEKREKDKEGEKKKSKGSVSRSPSPPVLQREHPASPRSGDESPVKDPRDRSRSPPPRRRKSASRSPVRPSRKRSGSRSPVRTARRRSVSPRKRRSKSRSRSPRKKKVRSPRRSRSGSRHRSKKDKKKERSGSRERRDKKKEKKGSREGRSIKEEKERDKPSLPPSSSSGASGKVTRDYDEEEKGFHSASEDHEEEMRSQPGDLPPHSHPSPSADDQQTVDMDTSD